MHTIKLSTTMNSLSGMEIQYSVSRSNKEDDFETDGGQELGGEGRNEDDAHYDTPTQQQQSLHPGVVVARVMRQPEHNFIDVENLSEDKKPTEQILRSNASVDSRRSLATHRRIGRLPRRRQPLKSSFSCHLKPEFQAMPSLQKETKRLKLDRSFLIYLVLK